MEKIMIDAADQTRSALIEMLEFGFELENGLFEGWLCSNCSFEVADSDIIYADIEDAGSGESKIECFLCGK